MIFLELDNDALNRGDDGKFHAYNQAYVSS